jgi:hypothetical protein
MKAIELPAHTASGTMRVEGHVRGYVSGMVDADFRGILHGQINAAISTETSIEDMENDAVQGNSVTENNEVCENMSRKEGQHE